MLHQHFNDHNYGDFPACTGGGKPQGPPLCIISGTFKADATVEPPTFHKLDV